MREPWTMPRLKVPAPQANRVAARLCPPRILLAILERVAKNPNTFECVVETTRHAGLETCDTTLGCWRKNCCALTALDGNYGTAPRALPWAGMLRPFRPVLCGVILDEESHGFSVDGTAQGLRYGRLGSCATTLGCWRKNCCALTALDGNYGIKTQGVALGCHVAAFQACSLRRHSG